MKKHFLYLIVLLLFVSCNKASNPKEMFLKRFAKGVIIDRVECKATNDQSYCLYMPTAYDIKKTFPVIYAFDSHGDGHIPVALLKETAEKYNYIVIGSNNSRNGLSSDDLNYALSQLFNDTKNKLSIDTTRMYMLGFSGGARIACSVAQSMQGVKGVVACSASFEAGSVAPTFTFIGISSDGDMNYLEMQKLHTSLQKLNSKAELILFEGKHEWPPKSIINEAFDIMQLYAIKDNTVPQNKSIINEYLNTNLQKVSKLKVCNQIDSLIKGMNILKRTINILNQLTDISKPKAMLDEILQITEVQNYLKEQASLEIYETQKQQEFMAAYQTKQGDWWNVELKKLDNDQKQANSLYRNVAKRLKGYISLSCYSYSNRALQSQDWKSAELFTSIYQKVDSENPDCYYALACLYANTGKKEKAVSSLQQASKFGFSNTSKLQNDPMLNPLRGMPEFDKMLNGK
ncbi:MAG: hypothetical protein HXX18_12455 [Bacteroidetes bacterium]|nr:hypothetical protein [Bacteroidota bacterium]